MWPLALVATEDQYTYQAPKASGVHPARCGTHMMRQTRVAVSMLSRRTTCTQQILLMAVITMDILLTVVLMTWWSVVMCEQLRQELCDKKAQLSTAKEEVQQWPSIILVCTMKQEGGVAVIDDVAVAVDRITMVLLVVLMVVMRMTLRCC